MTQHVSRRRGWLWWLLPLAVLAVGGILGPVLGLRYQARREREEALRTAALGRFADAEPHLRRTLQRDPGDLDVLEALTRGLLAPGRLDEAEPILTRWCELRPGDAAPFKLRMDLRHRRARAALPAADRQRLMGEAVADGQHALELDPQDDPVAQEVVWLLLQVGRFDEADRLCRRCLERKPGDPWLTYLLALGDHGRGAVEEAQALLDRLLRQHSGSPRGMLLRAVLYNEAGEPDRAIPLLRRVLALDPALRKQASYQLSLALARTGQGEEAKRLMAEVQKQNLDMLLADVHDPSAPGVPQQKAEVQRATDRQEGRIGED